MSINIGRNRKNNLRIEINKPLAIVVNPSPKFIKTKLDID